MIASLVKALLGWERKTEREKYLVAYRASCRVGRAASLLPIPLWLLFRWFRSDKHMPGWHSYGHTYGALFRRWKYRRVRLLEIGIGGYGESLGGRSLLAWQAFFPFGTIVAADIVPKQVLGGGRLRVRQLDQSSAVDLAALCREEGPFDIIVDDGSHLNAHQILTFERIWSALRDGGVYVIEDVQTSFWPGRVGLMEWDGARIGDPGFRGTCYGYFLELAKYVNHAEFLDRTGVDERLVALGRQITRIAFEHNLIVLWKGDNTEASTFVRRPERNRVRVMATV